MRIYLSGPMTGMYEANAPLFDRAAARLRAEGHEVFSPIDNDRRHGVRFDLHRAHSSADFPEGVTVRVLLGDDLAWICAHAEAVALLPGWEKSEGALAERQTAKALGLTIMELGKAYTRA